MILKNGENIKQDVDTRLDFGDKLAFAKHRNDPGSGGLATFTFKVKINNNAVFN